MSLDGGSIRAEMSTLQSNKKLTRFLPKGVKLKAHRGQASNRYGTSPDGSWSITGAGSPIQVNVSGIAFFNLTNMDTNCGMAYGSGFTAGGRGLGDNRSIAGLIIMTKLMLVNHSFLLYSVSGLQMNLVRSLESVGWEIKKGLWKMNGNSGNRINIMTFNKSVTAFYKVIDALEV